MTYEFIIDDEYMGISPKNFLKKKIDLPYNQIFDYIKNKRITLNGKKIKTDMKLKKGDIIKVWLDTIPKKKDLTLAKSNVSPTNLKIPLLYENSDFLVLNKLPGIIVQGAGDNEFSLSHHLEFLRRKNKDDSIYFHVHRLDKETSGVLVCSKNLVSRRDLNAVFKEKDMEKIYICLCKGYFKKSSGKVECKLERSPPNSKEKVFVSKSSGKYSLSEYKILGEYNLKGEPVSLVQVKIKTGVTHQIRVHMKSLNHPILGDWMYGNIYLNEKFKYLIPRQFLHAKLLSFNYKNKKYSFEADYPFDLKKVLKLIKAI